MGAPKRRRRQWANGFKHLARLGRPIYRRRKIQDVGQAIAAERRKAAAEAARRAKKK